MDVFQLLLAATKAAHDNETGKLATQTISSEIIYNLSPSKNVCRPLLNTYTDDTYAMRMKPDAYQNRR